MNMSEYKGRSVLITGGLGFIGGTLAQRLVPAGAKVTVLDARIDPYGWNEANLKEIRDGVEVVDGDVRDAALLEKLVPGKDFIFHLAAQVSRLISMERPLEDVAINVNGAVNLLNACRDLNRDAAIVFAGSRGQIGEPRYTPVDEEHPDNPTDVYGITKLTAEKLFLLYHDVYGMKTVSLRLGNVYGERCQMKNDHYGVLNLFVRIAMQGGEITVFGDGMQTRDYIHIEDVANAFLMSAAAPECRGRKFIVGSGVETVFLDMVKTVVETVGSGSWAHKPFPKLLDKIDIRKFLINSAALERACGWKAGVGLREGVGRTVEFYRTRLPEYL